MKKYFTFDEMLTPRFMTAFHLILQVIIVVVFVGSSVAAWRLQSIEGVVSALIVCVVSSIVARLVCEGIMVIFRIYAVMRDIRSILAAQQKSGAKAPPA